MRMQSTGDVASPSRRPHSWLCELGDTSTSNAQTDPSGIKIRKAKFVRQLQTMNLNQSATIAPPRHVATFCRRTTKKHPLGLMQSLLRLRGKAPKLALRHRNLLGYDYRCFQSLSSAEIR